MLRLGYAVFVKKFLKSCLFKFQNAPLTASSQSLQKFFEVIS